MSLVPAFCIWQSPSYSPFREKHSFENPPTRKIISWTILWFWHYVFGYFCHCVMCICLCICVFVFVFVFLVFCNLHLIFVWEIWLDCFNSDDDHDNFSFNRFSTRRNRIWANTCRGPRHVFARLGVLDLEVTWFWKTIKNLASCSCQISLCTKIFTDLYWDTSFVCSHDALHVSCMAKITNSW